MAPRPGSQGLLTAPRPARVRRDPPEGPPEGAGPYQRLMSDFWLRPLKNLFLLF